MKINNQFNKQDIYNKINIDKKTVMADYKYWNSETSQYDYHQIEILNVGGYIENGVTVPNGVLYYDHQLGEQGRMQMDFNSSPVDPSKVNDNWLQQVWSIDGAK